MIKNKFKDNMTRKIRLGLLSEAQEQAQLVKWGKLNDLRFVKLKNENAKNARQGAILNILGLSKGFPDLILPRPSNSFSIAFVEMKQNREYKESEKRTKTWMYQQEWLDYLNEQKLYYAFRAYGWIHAIKMLETFYFK